MNSWLHHSAGLAPLRLPSSTSWSPLINAVATSAKG
jgi:hypothetical protein